VAREPLRLKKENQMQRKELFYIAKLPGFAMENHTLKIKNFTH